MKTQIHSTDSSIHFMDFSSFEELTQHPKILVNLLTNYCNIFGEPDVWNEQYSAEEILEKLENELSGHATMRLCINTITNEVIGFCWAQLLNGNQIVAAIKSIHFYQKYRTPKIDESLQTLIGNKSSIYVHDLGINKSYRGKIPLEQLICPVIEHLSNQAQTRNLVFWSVSDTCIAWLAKKVGIDVALTLGKMQFFEGEFPAMEALESIVA